MLFDAHEVTRGELYLRQMILEVERLALIEEQCCCSLPIGPKGIPDDVGEVGAVPIAL